MTIIRDTDSPAPIPAKAWSETAIAAALARDTFNRNAIVLVPNCIWTGNECDLLVVEKGLRVIDVEVKISRADLRKDAKKYKWWCSWSKDPETGRYQTHEPPLKREWPVKVWKHYYAVPREIWDDALLDALPSPQSGVITLEWDSRGRLDVRVARRATPARDAYVLSPAEAVDVARLANLRYWEVATELDRAREQLGKKSQEGAAT